MQCPKCTWEGPDSLAIIDPVFGADGVFKKINYMCPKCGAFIEPEARRLSRLVRPEVRG